MEFLGTPEPRKDRIFPGEFTLNPPILGPEPDLHPHHSLLPGSGQECGGLGQGSAVERVSWCWVKPPVWLKLNKPSPTSPCLWLVYKPSKMGWLTLVFHQHYLQLWDDALIIPKPLVVMAEKHGFQHLEISVSGYGSTKTGTQQLDDLILAVYPWIQHI